MFEFVAQWKWQPNMKNFLAGKFFSRFSRWPYHSRIGEVAKTENWFNSSSKPVRVAPPPPLANPPPPPHFKPTHRKTRLGQRHKTSNPAAIQSWPFVGLFSVFGFRFKFGIGFFCLGFLGARAGFKVGVWSPNFWVKGRRCFAFCWLSSLRYSINYLMFDLCFTLECWFFVCRSLVFPPNFEFWLRQPCSCQPFFVHFFFFFRGATALCLRSF